MYDEINQQIKKLLTEGLRKYTHSPGVTEDEIYYFTKLLNPLKVSEKKLLTMCFFTQIFHNTYLQSLLRL